MAAQQSLLRYVGEGGDIPPISKLLIFKANYRYF